MALLRGNRRIPSPPSPGLCLGDFLLVLHSQAQTLFKMDISLLLCVSRQFLKFLRRLVGLVSEVKLT